MMAEVADKQIVKDEHATPEDVENLKKTLKESNEDRKRDKLRREAQRAHEWRVQVWAQMELKIRTANAQAEVLDSAPYVPFEPDFGDDTMLHHYSTMTLTK